MGNSLESLYHRFLESTGVSTDTRSIRTGDLFFALRGPNFNGNEYAAQALEKGAGFAVVDDPAYAEPSNTLLVEDSLKALQELALHHRRQFNGKVFALTGSNGKTTTKELINRVLSTKYQTIATEGNLNNHIGVPLTLLRIRKETEVAIIEMGANHVGEIANLCSIAEPEHGMITNIGEAHTETFGGIEGVFRGKTEMFAYLDKHDGTIFLNLSDPRLKPLKKKYEQVIVYPDIDVSFIEADPVIRFRMGDLTVNTQMVGAYNYQNMTAAISVGRYFKVEDETIATAIGTYVSGNHRSQVIRKGPLTIIMDGYNSNPTSMRLALESFVNVNGEKSLILADMKEVEQSDEKHRQLGEYLADHLFKQIFLIGEAMRNAVPLLPDSEWFPNADQLALHLESHPIVSGSVLIKGSRSMRLDKVLQVLEK